MQTNSNIFVSKESENKLESFAEALATKGYQVPKSIKEIKNFPYSDYRSLQEDINNGKAVVLRFSYEMNPDLISMLRPNTSLTLNMIITYLIPIASILLAIFYSGWFLFGLLFFFVGQYRVKKTYNNTVFMSAMTNELAFCILFFLRQISISDERRTFQHYFDRDTSTATTV